MNPRPLGSKATEPWPLRHWASSAASATDNRSDWWSMVWLSFVIFVIRALWRSVVPSTGARDLELLGLLVDNDQWSDDAVTCSVDGVSMFCSPLSATPDQRQRPHSKHCWSLALVHSRLDYYNSLMVDLPAYQSRRLYSMSWLRRYTADLPYSTLVSHFLCVYQSQTFPTKKISGGGFLGEVSRRKCPMSANIISQLRPNRRHVFV